MNIKWKHNILITSNTLIFTKILKTTPTCCSFKVLFPSYNQILYNIFFFSQHIDATKFGSNFCMKFRTKNRENKERNLCTLLALLFHNTVCQLGKYMVLLIVSSRNKMVTSFENIGQTCRKDYTDYEIENMTWQRKSDLIQKDPVTCATNFDHMVQLFIRDVLKSDEMPIGEIVDFFYRVEFQQRGSPHIHALFWVKDAPQYEKMLMKILYTL